jgi:hypothetical protein
MDAGSDDTDEAFDAFERGLPQRSVLDVERERIAKGHEPNDALLKHGGEMEDRILRAIMRESEELRSRQGSAEILPFPPASEPEGT